MTARLLLWIASRDPDGSKQPEVFVNLSQGRKKRNPGVPYGSLRNALKWHKEKHYLVWVADTAFNARHSSLECADGLLGFV